MLLLFLLILLGKKKAMRVFVGRVIYGPRSMTFGFCYPSIKACFMVLFKVLFIFGEGTF